MYANQLCSRIRLAFCKRTRLNRQESYFNGIWKALGGVRHQRSSVSARFDESIFFVGRRG